MQADEQTATSAPLTDNTYYIVDSAQHKPTMDTLSTPKIEQLCNNNWLTWETHMSIVLHRYGALEVMLGTSAKPNDPDNAAIWNSRDLVAQELITVNIKDEQVIHVNDHVTSAEMWANLWTVHEPHGQQSLISAKKLLYSTQAQEG